MIRVIVLTSRPHGIASLCLPELAKSDKIHVVSVVLSEGGVSTNRLKRVKRIFKKILKIGVLGALNGIRIRPWFQVREVEHLEILCDKWSVPLRRTGALNSDQTVELFKSANADLGLSLGNGYISKRIFTVPRLGMINVHCERLPEYQNARGVIWPIHNMERTAGLTIHQVDDKIDTGSILYQDKYPIEFHPTLKETVIRTTFLTAGKVATAVRHVTEDYAELSQNARPQTDGRSYTTPNFWQFLTMVRNNRKMFKSSVQIKNI